MKEKVTVAMSGGVDSSVAAALLKKQGFQVSGVFMRLNSSVEAEKRAKQITRKLNIPFRVLDLRKEFKNKIIKRFLKECRTGITPNPCVDCNKEIKFGLLMEKVPGADYFATGHYIRVKNGILLKGKDKEKDQSYFLWKLNQNQLKRVSFPIGEYTRAEVEKLAKKLGFSFFGVKKSTEICFVPATTGDFLKKHLKERPGKIVDITDKVLGNHNGLWFYTIGQRKGIKLPGGPYYVLEKDLKKNILIVTKKEKDLFKKELVVDSVNWVSGIIPGTIKAKVKIRYGSRGDDATIRPLSRRRAKIMFKVAQRAITPGQSAVFYKGEVLLGGGIIC